jgi:chorismate dehydratase
MTPVRLGAVGYLNARPCVVGLERDPRFDLRFDVPSRCASLLHAGSIDVGLIPSIEYLRGPGGADGYRLVPDVAIASTGPVASVAIYTTRPMADVRSIALDTSSRTSVALTRVLCARAFQIDPKLEPLGPDLLSMLERCDAALIIGDAALLLDHAAIRPVAPVPDRTLRSHSTPGPEAAVPSAARSGSDAPPEERLQAIGSIRKIDLGETWTGMTGLPFVYAFWAGWPEALAPEDVRTIQAARDAGVADPDTVSREYFSDSALHAVGARYLRDNIKYYLGEPELAGLDAFYRYASELGLVPKPAALRFYEVDAARTRTSAERLVPQE